MPPKTDVSRVLVSAVAGLDDLGFRWFLFGAQAVSAWGAPRLTNDVDLTVEMPEGLSNRSIRVLASHGFAPRFDFDEEFIRRTRVIPLVHSETDVPLDLVLAGPGLEEEFLARAVRMTVEGVEIPVISAEDLVSIKILAGRTKDLEDVRRLLGMRRDSLDLARIRDVLRRLEEALDQSDLVPAFERALSEAP